jgi:hypothetical protein
MLRRLNPWNHRADISAQAYLKPSKMAKKCHRIVSSEYYKKFCGDSKKILNFFWILGSNITGS